MGGSTRLLKKRWRHDIFGKDRRPIEKPWIQGIRDIIRDEGIRETTPQDGTDAGAQEDLYTDNGMSAFIELYATPQSKAKELVEFCEGFSLDHPDHISEGQPATAWLDDTCFRPQDSQTLGPTSDRLCRRYPGFLTPLMLRHYLKQERFDHKSEPDADRRLIAIADLNPLYMLVLAETAPGHQVDALADALWKHFALQTSLRCQTVLKGYAVYKLELHIPYYPLRKYDMNTTPASPPMGKQHRKWRDLTFLINGSFKPQKELTGIHDAHISIVICGTDEKRWIAYSFVDSYFDDGDEMGSDEFSHVVAMADQIAGCGNYGMPINANNPIWDPLLYFSKVACIRMRQVEETWADLVRRVENGVRDFIDAHPSSSHQGKVIQSGDEEAMDVFLWISRAMESIASLLKVLQSTNRVWTQFSANGDLDYFDRQGFVPQETQTDVEAHLQELAEIFAQFKDHEDRLKDLIRQCELYGDTRLWTLQLTAVGSKAAQRNEAAAYLNILAVAPLQVACNLLAIPASVPLLKQDWKSLVTLILIMVIGLQILQYLLYLVKDRIPWQRWRRRLIEQLPTINLNLGMVLKILARLYETDKLRRPTTRRATEETLVNTRESMPV
ncbi:uncharacterized protein EI97DRAFT_14260 [Westerdykella ornata]|uniref:Uncharacterized protein n=1 Tax=Westerdykella ornata TaxID=318751 RepID=A0A6A6JWE7_WESOR|nr:uncharacterized protein EI97DRAFT_14260 [Westerdykella ornata]KAF2280931.1 hypothetical protein EI97DRAFT_14260 [Westerdykella ornata]